jgi:hypothetical protein
VPLVRYEKGLARRSRKAHFPNETY